MNEWRTRDTRKQSNKIWGKLILAVLLVVAISLSLYKYSDLARHLLNGNDALISDTEIETTFRESLNQYRLSAVQIEKLPTNSRRLKSDYVTYKAYWPSEFPFIWFNSTLKEKTSLIEGLSVTSRERDDGKTLLMYFIDQQYSDTLGEIILVSSRGTQPEMSSIGFMFKEFADYKLEDALELIWMDMPFGFMLNPDQIPGEKLRKALSNSRGQCVLKIPTDKESWELILKAHKLAQTIANTDISEDNIRAVFESFPTLDGICLHTNSQFPPDREIMRMLVDQADYYRMTYVKHDSNPIYSDSLAYLRGLKIKDLGNSTDLSDVDEQNAKNALVESANDFTKSNKGIYLMKSDKTSAELLTKMKELYSRLNIVMSKPLRIAESIEKL